MACHRYNNLIKIHFLNKLGSSRPRLRRNSCLSLRHAKIAPAREVGVGLNIRHRRCAIGRPLAKLLKSPLRRPLRLRGRRPRTSHHENSPGGTHGVSSFVCSYSRFREPTLGGGTVRAGRRSPLPLDPGKPDARRQGKPAPARVRRPSPHQFGAPGAVWASKLRRGLGRRQKISPEPAAWRRPCAGCRARRQRTLTRNAAWRRESAEDIQEGPVLKPCPNRRR